MQSIVISTLIIGLFAFFYGRQQAKLYWPFRELNYDQFSKEKRDELSDGAHACGLAIALCLCLGFAVVTSFQRIEPIAFWQIFFKATFHFMAMLSTFSLVFDPSFAIAYGKPWYYLGDTAETDKVVKSFLGKHEGKTKFFVCLFITVTAIVIIKIFL